MKIILCVKNGNLSKSGIFYVKWVKFEVKILKKFYKKKIFLYEVVSYFSMYIRKIKFCIHFLWTFQIKIFMAFDIHP